jgi:hypothetical protein
LTRQIKSSVIFGFAGTDFPQNNRSSEYGRQFLHLLARCKREVVAECQKESCSVVKRMKAQSEAATSVADLNEVAEGAGLAPMEEDSARGSQNGDNQSGPKRKNFGRVRSSP